FCLRNPVRIEVDHRAVPSGDAPLAVACRDEPRSIPIMNARRTLDAAVEEKRFARLKAATPRFGNAVIVVRMGRALEKGMTFVHRGLELFQRHGDESLTEWRQIGRPAVGIKCPCIAKQVLNQLCGAYGVVIM